MTQIDMFSEDFELRHLNRDIKIVSQAKTQIKENKDKSCSVHIILPSLKSTTGVKLSAGLAKSFLVDLETAMRHAKIKQIELALEREKELLSLSGENENVDSN